MKVVTIKQDLRAGETVHFDGTATVKFIAKTGQRVRLEIKKAENVNMHVEKNTTASEMAKAGLTPRATVVK